MKKVQVGNNSEFEYDVEDGDKIIIANKNSFNLNCCACGLSHIVEVRILPLSIRQKVQMRFWVNKNRTKHNRDRLASLPPVPKEV